MCPEPPFPPPLPPYKRKEGLKEDHSPRPIPAPLREQVNKKEMEKLTPCTNSYKALVPVLAPSVRKQKKEKLEAYTPAETLF